MFLKLCRCYFKLNVIPDHTYLLFFEWFPSSTFIISSGFSFPLVLIALTLSLCMCTSTSAGRCAAAKPQQLHFITITGPALNTLHSFCSSLFVQSHAVFPLSVVFCQNRFSWFNTCTPEFISSGSHPFSQQCTPCNAFLAEQNKAPLISTFYAYCQFNPVMPHVANICNVPTILGLDLIQHHFKWKKLRGILF